MSRGTSPSTSFPRGPWSYLAWLVARQGRRVALAAVLGTAWTVGLALPPYLLSRAVDSPGNGRSGMVLGWAAALGGAQAQHVALARVVVADPHTLVLDEATAQLDPTAARHTERALAASMQGRTVVAVAHRLQTARDADRVVVMQDGCIIELGTHDELITADAAYAAMWRAWTGQT